MPRALLCINSQNAPAISLTSRKIRLGNACSTKRLSSAQACLLGGLQSLTDAELPIQTSDFYSKHMLPAKPEGESLTPFLLQ